MAAARLTEKVGAKFQEDYSAFESRISKFVAVAKRTSAELSCACRLCDCCCSMQTELLVDE